MKKNAVFLTIIVAATTGSANAAGGYVYANSLSANNIKTMQHTIFNRLVEPDLHTLVQKNTQYNIANYDDMVKLYGRTQIYGTMAEYGEYGDDGTVFESGRNGGDESSWPIVNNLWIDWHHHNTDMEFGNYDRTGVNYDLLMIGATANHTKTTYGAFEWGAFAGLVRATQENAWIDTDTRGGYFGIYKRYNANNLNISFATDAGAVSNDSKNYYGHDEFANIWIGIGTHASYKLVIDDTFAFVPNVSVGYTWIHSADYTSDSGDKIKNGNFNEWEITPGADFVKHITDGWFASIGGKYVMNFANGGNIRVNGVATDKLDSGHYWEYGIRLDKSIDCFMLGGNLTRYDGGLSGWGLGLNAKYLF